MSSIRPRTPDRYLSHYLIFEFGYQKTLHPLGVLDGSGGDAVDAYTMAAPLN